MPKYCAAGRRAAAAPMTRRLAEATRVGQSILSGSETSSGLCCAAPTRLGCGRRTSTADGSMRPSRAVATERKLPTEAGVGAQATSGEPGMATGDDSPLLSPTRSPVMSTTSVSCGNCGKTTLAGRAASAASTVTPKASPRHQNRERGAALRSSPSGSHACAIERRNLSGELGRRDRPPEMRVSWRPGATAVSFAPRTQSSSPSGIANTKKPKVHFNGHLMVFRNHSATQSVWNKCPQGSRTTLSSSWKSSRQMAHSLRYQRRDLSALLNDL
mmetsp:Transcript_68427/g.198419  ORF Transcript_68427/g.198419 Transcript_68427/m.198419 type:complete len:272 (+) Transcript_68427:13-828(+)